MITMVVFAAACGGELASSGGDDDIVVPSDGGSSVIAADANSFDAQRSRDGGVADAFVPFDAATFGIDASAPEIAACLTSPYAIHVRAVTDDDAAAPVDETILADAGNWKGELLPGAYLQVYVRTGDDAAGDWTINIDTFEQSLEAGVYDFDASTYQDAFNHNFQIAVPNVPPCNESPFVGELHIYELTYPDYSETTPIDRFFLTFDGHCDDRSLVGCVSFGNR